MKNTLTTIVFVSILAGCGGGGNSLIERAQATGAQPANGAQPPRPAASSPAAVASMPATAPMSDAAKVLRKKWEDPGLLGPDRDGNGIRDDVDDFIDQYTLVGDEKKMLLKLAKATTDALSVGDSRERAAAAIRGVVVSVDCINEINFQKNSQRLNLLFSIQGDIFAKIVNTRKRVQAYEKFENHLPRLEIDRKVDHSRECK